ncbi:MAG: MFS transporter [Candidatus Lokiarchaeota archaeon]|nr:MFS transporter [Candidatus Lokiarchaeota archaeon]
MEQQLLNTYIDHILRLDPIFIGIMVSFSAVVGLIFMFVFGILSDNTRSRFGRRRPYLLLGGLVAGTAMITFGFSHVIFGQAIDAYIFCFVIDVVVIGIASNAYYAAQRVQVPDLVEQKYRGRVNSIVNLMSLIGMLMPAVLTLLANQFFSIPDPDDPGCIDADLATPCSRLLTAEGHVLMLSVGGVAIMIAAVLGFAFLKDNKLPDALPPKLSFTSELRRTFNFKELKKQKEFFKLILAMLVFMSGVSAILSYLLNIIFDLGIETFGLIIILGIALPSVLILIFVLGKYTDKVGRKKVTIPTICMSCAGFVMMPFIIESGMIADTGSVDQLPSILVVALAFTLIVLGMVGVTVPASTWSQDLLPEGKKGQFNGIYNIINTVSQVIGAMTAGILTTYLSGVFSSDFTWIFIIVPVFFLASIPLFMKVEETLVQREPGAESST